MKTARSISYSVSGECHGGKRVQRGGKEKGGVVGANRFHNLQFLISTEERIEQI